MSRLYNSGDPRQSYIVVMTEAIATRRSFLAAAGSLAGAIVVRSAAGQPPAADPALFITTFDDAWARHDPHALAMLHAERVVVVNRFGSMLEGRAEVETAMHFLHGPGGPFHDITFPRQRVVLSRLLGSDMAVIHTKWSNPTMGPEDQLARHDGPMRWVDMIATCLVTRSGPGWELVQHDLHSVDPTQFPFKTKWNS